jgi:hypothetical protein
MKPLALDTAKKIADQAHRAQSKLCKQCASSSELSCERALPGVDDHAI